LLQYKNQNNFPSSTVNVNTIYNRINSNNIRNSKSLKSLKSIPSFSSLRSNTFIEDLDMVNSSNKKGNSMLNLKKVYCNLLDELNNDNSDGIYNLNDMKQRNYNCESSGKSSNISSIMSATQLPKNKGRLKMSPIKVYNSDGVEVPQILNSPPSKFKDSSKNQMLKFSPDKNNDKSEKGLILKKISSKKEDDISMDKSLNKNNSSDDENKSYIHVNINIEPPKRILSNMSLSKNYGSELDSSHSSEIASEEELNEIKDLYKSIPISPKKNNIIDSDKIEVVHEEEEQIMTDFSINDFRHLLKLGQGGYGRVDLYRKKNTNENYAIKTVDISVLVIN